MPPTMKSRPPTSVHVCDCKAGGICGNGGNGSEGRGIHYGSHRRGGKENHGDNRECTSPAEE